MKARLNALNQNRANNVLFPEKNNVLTGRLLKNKEKSNILEHLTEEQKNKILSELTECQQRCILEHCTAVENHVCVANGASGTGKTICDISVANEHKVLYATQANVACNAVLPEFVAAKDKIVVRMQPSHMIKEAMLRDYFKEMDYTDNAGEAIFARRV